MTLKYLPLDSSAAEIRLIIILPPDPGPSSSQTSSIEGHFQPNLVSCRLEHFSLQNPKILSQLSQLNWTNSDKASSSANAAEWRYEWGDYVALSYAWGDPKPMRNIVMNGHQTAVRSNLEAALRVLRDKEPIRMGYAIWVDALCINQDDVLERNEEVKRMRRIYKHARDVVVWIGEEENGSAEAIKLIKMLSKSCEDGTDKALGGAPRKSPDLFGYDSWRALSQFMDRAYWHRLWIMQEIAMGSSQTPILCGNQTVAWGEVYQGTVTFASRNIDTMFTYIEKACRDAGVKYSGLNRNKIIHLWEEQNVQAGRKLPQLMPVLDLGRQSLATDPKDKVYGLLGLMLSEVADQIQPNYDLSLAEVYTSFAKATITANQSLEILEQCTWPNPHMPSWVPDWTNRNHFRLFSGRSTYSASLSRPAMFQFDATERRLSCQGFVVDKIDGLGASYYESHRSTEPGDTLIQPAGSNNPYGSEAGLHDALWRTLTGNRVPEGRLAPDSYQCLLDYPLELTNADHVTSTWRGRKAFNLLLEQNADLKIAGKKLGSFFPMTRKVDPEASRDALERIFRFHRSRRLMITLQGYPGLVPIAAQPGDVVYILLGCNVPVVLRAIDDQHFKVIGCCYLQGFMEGEAMAGLDQEREQLEIISLC